MNTNVYNVSWWLCLKAFVANFPKQCHIRGFLYPHHSKQHIAVCSLSLHLGNSERRKTLEQKFIFQIGTLSPHGISKGFSFD